MLARRLTLIGALIQLTRCLPHEASNTPLMGAAAPTVEASRSNKNASNATNGRAFSSKDDPSCPWIRAGKLIQDQARTFTLSQFTQTLDSVWLGKVAHSCGNWGDCEYVVYKSCGNARFQKLWGPDYAQGVQVKRNSKGELLLVVMSRTAQSGCDVPLRSQFLWKRKKWHLQHVACWPREQGGAWEVEACGQPPPLCD